MLSFVVANSILRNLQSKFAWIMGLNHEYESNTIGSSGRAQDRLTGEGIIPGLSQWDE